MERQDLASVLRSFLRGLLASSPENESLKDVIDWLVSVHHQLPPPDKRTLLEKVRKVIKVLQRDVFIVLDGLDVFPLQRSEDDEVERKDVLDLILDIVEDASPNLHVLVVSKFEEDIKKRLLDDATLNDVVKAMDVEDGLRTELDEYIDRTLDKDDSFNDLADDLKLKIEDSLKRDRTFLWVVSLLKDLRTCNGNERQIKKQLNKVPNSMAARYEKALKDILKQDHMTMRVVLMWLLRHKRDTPLTNEEVAEAVPDCPAKDLITLLKGQLVSLVKLTGIENSDISPSYYVDLDFCAKEHLEARCNPAAGETEVAPAPWFIFSDEEAHHELVTRCLKVLLWKDGESPTKERPLKKYAAQYWHEHYLLFRKTMPNKENIAKIDGLIAELFVANCPPFKAWLDTWNPDENFTSTDFDWKNDENSDDDNDDVDDDDDDEQDDEEEDADEADHDDDNDDNDDSDGDSESQISSDSHSIRARLPRGHPVYYAVKLQLLDIAVKMIQEGEPFARAGREGTVLQLALYHEHWEVIDALLRRCDNLEKAVRVRSGPHGTPLYIASAKATTERVDILKSLISKGAQADGTDSKQDGKYGNALHAAAYFGRTDAVKILVDEGNASVDQERGIFGTALQAAAVNGRYDIIDILIGYGADPTIVSGFFGTALQAVRAGELDGWLQEDRCAAILLRAIEGHGIKGSGGSGIGWKTAFDRLESTNRRLFRDYHLLFFDYPQIPDNFKMATGHRIFAGALRSWKLPAARNLANCDYLLDTILPFKTPAREQLEDIRRALPDFTKCLREFELNQLQFFYKALFWAGINYILTVSITPSPSMQTNIHPGPVAYHSVLFLCSIWTR